MDVKRAADLYAQGWTLRQIGAELGVHWSAVSDQLQSAGVTVRRGGPPAHPASTQKILELRDQGLTWTEVAERVDMTVSGAWSRYCRARPPKSPRLGRWQQVLADALDQNLEKYAAVAGDLQSRLEDPDLDNEGLARLVKVYANVCYRGTELAGLLTTRQQVEVEAKSGIVLGKDLVQGEDGVFHRDMTG